MITMPMTGQAVLRGGGGVPPADDTTIHQLIDAIPRSLRGGVDDELEMLQPDLQSNHKLLSLMHLRVALEHLTANMCEALSMKRGDSHASRAPVTCWVYLEHIRLVSRAERALMVSIHDYLQQLEVDALRVDGPGLRCAWAAVLGAMDLLGERARMGGVA
jgi:hypothetical protein